MLRFLRTTDITRGPIKWGTVPFCFEPPNDVDRYLLRAGDIVVSRAGSVGFSALIDDCPPSVFASYLIRFRPALPAMARYLVAFMRSPQYWSAIGAESAGIALANVNAKKLSAIKVPVPPLPVQQAIVEELDKRLAEVAVGEQLFGKALLGLDQHRTSLLHTLVRADEVCPLGDVADIASGLTKGRRTQEPVHARPFLRAANVRDGLLDLEEVKTIDATDREAERFRLVEGDVLLVEGSGSPGRLGQGWVWEGQVEHCLHQNHVFRARPDKTRLLPRYLAWTLQSPAARGYFRRASKTTSGLATINRQQVGGLPIPLPPIRQQQYIIDELDTALAAAEALRLSLSIQMRAADVLRRTILHRAFVGELTPQSDESAVAMMRLVAAAKSELDGGTTAPQKRRAVLAPE